MGVKTCSRENCDSIMCDTYVPTIGYVCNDCQEEFEKYVSCFHLNPKNESTLEMLLSRFMQIEKDYKKEDINVKDFFKQHTK